MSAATRSTFAETNVSAGLHRPFTLANVDPHWLFKGALFLILFNVIVDIRYTPAAPFGDVSSLKQTVMAGADGSAGRQFLYLGIFLFTAALGFLHQRERVFTALAFPYHVACVWCLMSFAWAIHPGISFRRALGMYIILQATCICIQGIGVKATLETVRAFLMAVITVSLASVLLSRVSLFAFAVHPTNEADTSLIGAWRGVMMHKNVAGAVMTHATIVFLHFGLNRRRVIDFVFLALALLFLVGTKSKTSIALDGFILAAGLTYRVLFARPGGRRAFLTLLASVTVCAGILAIVQSDRLYAFFTSPGNLSGRIAIWQSLLGYIGKHIWFGSGYGSFWAIGGDSPIFSLATKDFVRDIGHSHSGYFEILLSTGLIGLVLAVIALVIWPAMQLLAAEPARSRVFAMCFSTWLFGVLQNLTESQFFSPDKQSWIFVVVAICVIKNYVPERLNAGRRFALPRTSGSADTGHRRAAPATGDRPATYTEGIATATNNGRLSPT